MSKFSVGDKVVCINSDGNTYIKEGCEYTVVSVVGVGGGVVTVSTRFGNYGYPCNLFEPLNTKYNLNTQPWFIKVTNPAEYLAAKQWLIENGWTGRFVHGDNCPNCINQLSNVEIDLSVVDRTNWSQTNWFSDENVPEIKLSFKTTVDKAEYPEVVLPSAKDKEIERIQNEMQKLQQDLEQLKGGK